ncbi:CDP-diacylglycerol--serine O-phosphatidyltransferase [bacterium BMS3Abin03]|nr:CDP-diacylglycerol--serine O-phosphatidyltransferase [bacterium BMS3Abin03]MCG6959320.1 CDP-diacylglycerol--serine O-phosphatidyltransferase [bacterium BMS3Abin03]
MRPRITPSIIPNLFTSMNMFCGFLSIITAAKGNYNYAAWLIIVAAGFDALDGLVARLTNSSSELGVELDSLSDIISFGCAPSFLLYSTYFSELENLGIILSSFPLIAGGFRLARFNVQLIGYEKSFFIGLPIPTAALTITSFILAFYNNGFAEPYSSSVIPMVIIISYLMISNIRYETLPKFSWAGIKEKPFHFIFITIAIVLVLLFYKTGLFYTFVLLIVIGIFRHIYSLIKKRIA